MPIERIAILGTGLIGASVGLALRSHGYAGSIIGWDPSPSEIAAAQSIGAIDSTASDPISTARASQLILLSGPVFTILDWLDRLRSVLQSGQLVTDVGSVKGAICEHARGSYNLVHTAGFLAGHPMAGKEHAGLEFADPDLFQGAAWFVTPVPGQRVYDGLSGEYLEWVDKIGARIASMDAKEHDELCAWISHLPQLISTALAAALVDEYGEDAPLLEAGGRALREMTRTSSSPYSMWRDVALTNKTNIRTALVKLEQHLAYIRENLDTRELALEFERAHQLKKIAVTKGKRASSS